MTIRSRITERGNANESSWPSDYGEGKRGRFRVKDGKCEYLPDYKDMVRKHKGVIEDTILGGLKHMGSGKYFDSKAEFRKETKRLGYEETGGEPAASKDHASNANSSEQDYVDAVKKAINDCRYGNSGLSEYEREKCKRIDRQRNNHG